MIYLLIVLQVKVLQLCPRVKRHFFIDIRDLLLQLYAAFNWRFRITHVNIFVYFCETALGRGMTLSGLRMYAKFSIDRFELQ